MQLKVKPLEWELFCGRKGKGVNSRPWKTIENILKEIHFS